MTLKNPPLAVFDASDTMPCNYFRFRLSPEVVIGAGALVKRSGEEMRGEPVELIARHHTQSDKSPYERLLGDAVRGDGSLFTQDDSVEAAWRVVDPVLHDPLPVVAVRSRQLGAAAGESRARGRRGLARSEAGGILAMLSRDTVFLLDVDDTLLDNDRFGADLGNRLESDFGAEARKRYWAIFEELRAKLRIRRLSGELAAVPRRPRR